MESANERARQALSLVCSLSLLILSAGCETASGIDRALYSVAETVSERDRLTGKRTLNFSRRPEQIKKADARAQQQIDQIRRAGKPLNEEVNSLVYSRLTRIFKRIHAVSHFSNETWHVVLLPNSAFSAFVMGGSYVFVNIGLMRQLRDDAEVAAVLGHEMGHVVANHVFEQMAHQFAVGLADSGSARREGYTEAFTNLQEQEADRVGVLYTALAGYDPAAASRIWAKKAQARSRQWSYFRTHPAVPDRARETLAVANEVTVYYQPGQPNNQYEKLLTCNVLWCPSKKVEAAAGEGGGTLAILGAALDAYTKHLKAKTERARQEAAIVREKTALAVQRNYRLGSDQHLTGQQVRFGSIPGPIIGKTYKGLVSNYRSNKKYPAAIAFVRTAKNQVAGRYVYQDGARRAIGNVAAVDSETNGTLIFRWTIGSRRGWAKLDFSSDGTEFRGVWGYQRSVEPGGRWSGSINEGR